MGSGLVMKYVLCDGARAHFLVINYLKHAIWIINTMLTKSGIRLMVQTTGIGVDLGHANSPFAPIRSRGNQGQCLLLSDYNGIELCRGRISFGTYGDSNYKASKPHAYAKAH